MKEIWIFNGDKNTFPSAVFETKEDAIAWIKANKLSGSLSLFPLNISIYDWAIKNNYFAPKNEFQKSATNIANFSTSHLIHCHYLEGEED